MNWIDELQAVTKRVYSQENQDGIIESIFKHIGTTNKQCVEFGFNSRELTTGSGSNVARLVVEDGWTPLLLDSDYENPSINLHRERRRSAHEARVLAGARLPFNRRGQH